jgi:hypothetical protein
MSLVEKAAAVTNGSFKVNETLVPVILSEAAKFNYKCYKVMVPDERSRYNLASYATRKYSSVTVTDESTLEPLIVRPCTVSCYPFVYRFSLDFATDH